MQPSQVQDARRKLSTGLSPFPLKLKLPVLEVPKREMEGLLWEFRQLPQAEFRSQSRFLGSREGQQGQDFTKPQATSSSKQAKPSAVPSSMPPPPTDKCALCMCFGPWKKKKKKHENKTECAVYLSCIDSCVAMALCCVVPFGPVGRKLAKESQRTEWVKLKPPGIRPQVVLVSQGELSYV